ncbi:MAG: thiamine pyrophosphate-dependent enzyme [bacterium]|nr:thiamine pyrophosphate-dependent enzyme [bacterium]
MRSKDFGVIPGLSKQFDTALTLEMFRRVCLSRNFEMNVKIAADAGLIKYPIYLSLGKEAISAALSVVYEKPDIFAQHRAHDTYICYGGNLIGLIDEILARPTGIAKGMGGSASIHEPNIKMHGHSGLLGDQIPIAVGHCIGTNSRTLAIMGDAAAEEDYVLGALGFASHRKIPILFVCEDNNLSLLTEKKIRRNWEISDVARAFKMPSIEITDDPWLVMHTVQELLKQKLPAFLQVHTCRVLWHAGTGIDGPPEWDRFAMIKEEMAKLGLSEKAEKIEAEAKAYIDGLWETQKAKK